MVGFEPFNESDFALMEEVRHGYIPPQLEQKVSALRHALGEFREFGLSVFRNRITRRPTMRGEDGLVFGHARSWEGGKHWYLYNVGGDQDMVQLNIGMCRGYIRVGLGFQIGRQVAPKMPGFQLPQTFLGARPPLPFRQAFYECIAENGLAVEDRQEWTTPEQVLLGLETYVVPADQGPHFIFVGKMWGPEEAKDKTASDFRDVFRKLLPFYEALILMGGRFRYYDVEAPSD